MKIYNNPACSKCANVLALIQEKNITPEIINYLENPPTAEELKDIIKILGVSPIDIIRKGETVFQEKYAGKTLSEEEWIEAMTEHPILIERPIIIHGNKAVIGRPPVRVLEVL